MAGMKLSEAGVFFVMATDRNDDTNPRFVTARDLPGFVFARTGLRLTRGKLKLASARGGGPPVAGMWGNCRLFDAAGSLDWARAQVKPYEAKQRSPNLRPKAQAQEGAKQSHARPPVKGITAAE